MGKIFFPGTLFKVLEFETLISIVIFARFIQ